MLWLSVPEDWRGLQRVRAGAEKMNNEPWSPEKVALLRELWSQNLSGRQMEHVMAQKKMPVPRNAIFKKAYRMGLPRRAPDNKPQNISAYRPTKIERASALQISVMPSEQSSVDYKAPIIDRAAKYDLRAGCCWPLGDPKSPNFRYCGEVREGRNYCAAHKKRAYKDPFNPD